MTDTAVLDLQAALRTFTQTWPTLADPEHAPRRGTTGGRTNGDPRLPGGTDRLHVLAGISQWTVYWTNQLIAQPGTLALTADLEPLDASQPAQLATGLLPHVPWIIQAPQGEDSAAYAAVLARHATALEEQVRHTRPVVGECPVQLEGEEACGGTLRAYLGEDARAADMGGAVIACEVDPRHRWDDMQWRDLGYRLGHITAAEPVLMNAETLAAWLTVRFARPISRGNVDLWKHRYPWFPRPDKDGLFDRVRVAEWMIQRNAA